MSILLLFFILAVISLPFTIWLTYLWDAPAFLASLFACAFLGVACATDEHSSFGEECSYTAEATKKTVFAYTPYGDFQSNLKEDFDKWMKNPEGKGVVIHHYNHFGAELKKSFSPNLK